MAEKHGLPIEEIDRQIICSYLAEGEDLQQENYPHLGNISARFVYQLMPRPTVPKAPEYVYVPLQLSTGHELKEDATLRLEVLIAKWNMCWEAGYLRHDMFADGLPPALQWLEHLDEQNVYLIPKVAFHHYHAYTPLYHLLPRRTLEYFGLLLLKKGLWPEISFAWAYERILPKDFDNRLAQALASHIWPLLSPGSPRSAFSASDPLQLLAHNLDFWLPYANRVIENRLRAFPRTPLDEERQIKALRKARRGLPPDVKVDQPLCGGSVWQGEEEAWIVTQEIIKAADENGKLRAIIEAVRSHRVEEDFSSRWSYAREDFERKLYFEFYQMSSQSGQRSEMLGGCLDHPIHPSLWPYSQYTWLLGRSTA